MDCRADASCAIHVCVCVCMVSVQQGKGRLAYSQDTQIYCSIQVQHVYVLYAVYIHPLVQILQIEFSPKIEEVAVCMTTVTGAMMSTVSEFHRLPEILSKKKSKKPVRLA